MTWCVGVARLPSAVGGPALEPRCLLDIFDIEVLVDSVRTVLNGQPVAGIYYANEQTQVSNPL